MRVRVALAVLTVLLTTACSGGSGGSAPSAAPHAAAEPATAPPTASAAAGRSVPVGDAPEGLAVDPKTGLVAVAVRNPDRLRLLDPSTLAVVNTVPLPGAVRHLQAYDGRILVPCETANEFLVVDAASGSVLSTTPVGKQPHDATKAASGAYVVGDEFGRSLSVVSDGVVQRTVAGTEQPGGVSPLTGSTVAAIDVLAYTLATFDVSSGARLALVAAGSGPTHVGSLSDSTVAVTDTRGNALLVFSTSPLRQVFRLPLPGTPYGLAADQQSRTVWTTLTARNEVVGFAWNGSSLTEIARYPTPEQPNTVAVGPGAHAVYVTGTGPGTVQLITR